MKSFLFVLLLFAAPLFAQAPPFNVQHNGVPQFGANFLQHNATSPVYNFCDSAEQCGNVVPPPNDPGAYTNLVVTWMQSPPVTVSYDVTQFFNLFGHIKPALPVQQWPGANGTTIKYLDSTAKYMRLRLNMPMNPGTLSHFLKAVSYGASAGIRAKYAVVSPGAPWPAGADTPCYKSSQLFSDQVVININPDPPNTTKCSVAPGTSVDVLIDALSNGSIALSFN